MALIIIFFLVFLFFAFRTLCALFKTKVPFAKTPTENLIKIFKEINLPKNSVVYDLGCGDGRFLFLAEKLGYRAVGYELSLYPFIKCLLKKIIKRSSIKIVNKNFHKDNFFNADVVFLFLVGRVMEEVGKKLNGNLKKGALVISYGFKIPNWDLFKTIKTEPSETFIYKI